MDRINDVDDYYYERTESAVAIYDDEFELLLFLPKSFSDFEIKIWLKGYLEGYKRGKSYGEAIGIRQIQTQIRGALGLTLFN